MKQHEMAPVATTAAGVWLMILLVLNAPFIAHQLSPLRNAINVEPPSLDGFTLLLLFAIAVAAAHRWLKSGRWRRLRIVVAVAGMTALLWFALLILFSLGTRATGMTLSAPELLLMLGGLAFLCAVPLVAWAERNLTVPTEQHERMGRTSS